MCPAWPSCSITPLARSLKQSRTEKCNRRRLSFALWVKSYCVFILINSRINFNFETVFFILIKNGRGERLLFNSSFRNMKWLKVSLVSWMRHKSTPSTTQHFFRLSLQYSGDNEYSCEKRGCVKVKCLGHEHNTVTPARPRISTNRSGVQSANHYNSTSPCPFLFQIKKNRGRKGNRNSHLAAFKTFFFISITAAMFSNHLFF